MAAQTAHDLKSLVSRRVGLKRRVVLLSSEPSLVAALQANGCEVLVDPDDEAAIEAFGAEVVVGFDGLMSDFTGGLQMLKRSAPQAELVVSFANASSAQRLIQELTGTPVGQASAEPEVKRQLNAAGYLIKARDVVVSAQGQGGLAIETQVALRQLFEQLNPDAAADRLLLTATRGAAATEPDRDEALVSVVIAASAENGAEIEGTLRSLSRQLQRPIEVVVVTPLNSPANEATEKLVSQFQSRAGLLLAHLNAEGPPAQLWNVGLGECSGRFVACVSAGDLFEPTHFSKLLEALKASEAAWARSQVPSGITTSACLFDTVRLATFPLQFADIDSPQTLLSLRLSALFTPAQIHQKSVDAVTHESGDADALLYSMSGRPLRMLQTMRDALQKPEVPALADQLRARAQQVSPQLTPAFDLLSKAVSKVGQAIAEARAQAEAELGKKSK